jgi:hypothetical protein
MNKNEIMKTVNRVAHKALFKVKKYSPEILMTTGIIGGVASAVLACKATIKLDEVLEPAKNTIDQIHGVKDGTITIAPDAEYTEEDARKDLMITYVQAGVGVVKLYAPSIILGALSITSILAAHNIIRKRNVALTAAYAALDETFKTYRGRVKDRYGEEIEKQIRYGTTVDEIEVTETDEKGKTKTKKEKVESYDISANDYNRVFDQHNPDGSVNPNWTYDPYHNLNFLKAQQNYANHRLQADGYLLLNDVYDMLGFPQTKPGMVVGWIYDEKNPVGDNYIDFGLYDNGECTAVDFKGLGIQAKPIPLDFNVDGDIYSRM